MEKDDLKDLEELNNFVEHYKAQGCEIGYQVDRVRAYNPRNYQTVAVLETSLGGAAAMLALQQNFSIISSFGRPPSLVTIPVGS